MDLDKVVKELSYEKKLAIARFALEVAAADGEIDQSELLTILAICQAKLDLDLTDKIDTITETDYNSVLVKFSMEEAVFLGIVLGVIAKADGVVSSVEVRHTRSLLQQAGLNNVLIEAVIETFENS